MEWIAAVCSALASVAAIAGFVEYAAKGITAWYLAKQKSDTLAAIADAAAFAAHAQTEEDRYAAAQKWHDALSRPRISP